jgi:hypothetical protein
MDMDVTDCGNRLFLYHSGMQHGDTEELHDALTYNILWIQIVP